MDRDVTRALCMMLGFAALGAALDRARRVGPIIDLRNRLHDPDDGRYIHQGEYFTLPDGRGGERLVWRDPRRGMVDAYTGELLVPFES
jgi:hypothetical protein